MPAVQVFPLQLATLDLSLMPASLTSIINEVDPHIAKQPPHHASQHEDLLTLSTLVQESFLAVELLRHVLSFAIAAATSDDSVIENGGYQSWTFNGVERHREVRRIQVLVQLNEAENVIHPFVYESQLHVATQLFVGQLQKILGNKDDCGYCKDTPTPTAVETTQLTEDPSASEPACLWTSNQSSV